MQNSPLRKLRHKKGWRLIQVSKLLTKQGTPVSWPTLIKIDHGFKKTTFRLETIKIKYTPSRRILADIARLFNVKVKDVYKDMSK